MTSEYSNPLSNVAAPPSQPTAAYSSPQVVINPPSLAPAREPFAVKVMRLPSPSFFAPTPLEWRLDTHLATTESTTPGIASVSSGGSFALTPSLLLPTNIGTVYLGETFRACVSVWAQGAAGSAYQAVGIKLELQTSSRRWTLVDTTPAPLTVAMAAGSTKDLLVSHNLAELGVNCLVCLVTFKDELGDRRTFQKFFKFHVHDPFTIHTTIHAREGILLAEVALTSLVQRAVTLARVQFEPTDTRIGVEDLNGGDDAQAEKADTTTAAVAPVESSGTSLAPPPTAAGVAASRSRSSSLDVATSSPSLGVLLPGQSSRTFLFRFTVPHEYTDPQLGRLQIRWSSLAGENGRIKSSAISRTAKTISGVECTLVDAPPTVEVEQVFEVRAQIRNSTSNPAIAVVQLLKDRMGTLLAVGPSTRQLGILSPGQTMPFAFELVGVGLGVQRVSGLRVSLTACLPGSNMPNNNATITQDCDHLHQLEVVAAR